MLIFLFWLFERKKKEVAKPNLEPARQMAICCQAPRERNRFALNIQFDLRAVSKPRKNSQTAFAFFRIFYDHVVIIYSLLVW